MKKITLFLVALSLPILTMAQGAFDALKYSQQFYEGTARSVAMGNAFTSLGGDIGALSINPAASGVYRYSEFIFTPTITNSVVKSNYLGKDATDNMAKFGLSSIGFVSSFKEKYKREGLLNFNIAFALNKVNNYTNRSSASGQTAASSWLSSLAANTSGIHARNLDITNNYNPFYDYPAASWRSILAWNSNLLDTLPDSGSDYIGATENINGTNIVMGGLLNQDFFRESTGNISEFVLNLGGNFSNKLFFGANLGIQSLIFTDKQTYSETAVNPSNFNSKFSSFKHSYSQTTNGLGINLKVGVIYVPIKEIRLGASISTPTFFSMSDEWEESIQANYSDGYRRGLNSPLGEYKYILSTPMRVNLGASCVLGKFAILSIDYEAVDYASMKLDKENNKHAFDKENSDIKSSFKSVSNIRTGFEVKPDKSFAIRGGYSYYQNPEKKLGSDTHIVSGGFGFMAEGGIFADLTYQQKLSQSENFSLYSDVPNHNAPVGSLSSANWKLLLTIGFKF